MPRSKTEFARLLSEAIHNIRLREPKKLIRVIHDELGAALGKSGAAIEYWRKGNIPSKKADVEKLAREIVSRCDLGREWLAQFLDSAGYPDSLTLCDELFPPPIPSHIPSKLYRKLVGRDSLVEKIMAALLDPDGRWIVTIDGMGGIGKTALAYEIADRCLDEHHFASVVWEKASRSDQTSREPSGSDLLTFETVLNAIAFQLGAPDISKLKTTVKQARVQELLRNQRVLVVLDNLETAAESQNEIADRLRLLLRPSKGLLTSRHRFKDDVYQIHLSGLDKGAALEFIHQEAEDKHIGCVQIAKPGELEQIVTSTGGSPLAIKLVVGQLGHMPLNTVLEHLRKVRPLESEAEEDDYIRFYKFIYFPSWNLLSDAGKQLLISMAVFVPGVGGTLGAIRTVSGLADDVLMHQINALWRLSLLEVGEM